MDRRPDIDGSVARGRGARSNRSGRFETTSREGFDDGWDLTEDAGTLRTTVSIDATRTILARNHSPDVPFDVSLNPYRGCEHGCVYCFARPSHAYLNLSPGLDFETRLVAKPEAPRLLRETLARRGYRPQVIAIGTNTDPYQPIEKRMGVMRGVLGVLSEARHPVSVVTKGRLVERDADLLGEMGQAGLAAVGISVTTLDPALARAMEPRAAAPAHRLRAIETLAKAGCPVRLMVAPVAPGLTDHELEAILAAGRDAGAASASYIVLRLPREVAAIWREWLEARFPDRAARVMNRVRQVHGGRDYDPEWGRRMRGSGPHADLLARRFEVAVRRLGYSRTVPPLRCDLFRPPRDGSAQLSLF
jgi:DNA repair photolyase